MGERDLAAQTTLIGFSTVSRDVSVLAHDFYVFVFAHTRVRFDT